MKNKNKSGYAQALAISVNVIMMTIPFIVCWFMAYDKEIVMPFYFKGYFVIIGLYMLLYTSFGRLYDAFLIPLVRISEMVYSQLVSLFMTNGIMYFVIVLLMRKLANPAPLMSAFVLQFAVSMVWTRLTHKWYFNTFAAKKTAIIYDGRRGLENLVREYGLEKKFDIQKVISVHDCLDDITVLEGVETAFFSGIHSSDRNVLLKYCIYNNISVYVIPRIGDLIMSGAKKMHLFHLPMLRVGRYNPPVTYLAIKRLVDIVLSFTALVIASPVMLVTAMAIKLTDGGPVMYTQTRLTKDRKVFTIHKFRSMRVDAEKDGVARLSSGDSDSRITPVGRFIRKVRIDELPQLFDILRGDLTIVGPRPERPEIARQYEQQMPEFALRLQAKAGLTGYRQVYGKYNTTPYDKLQMDLMYIANPSIIVDMQIILATIKILFMPESTEGVAAGNTTALLQYDETEKETVEN